MTLYIQDYKTYDVLFRTEDFIAVPNKGESLSIDNKWYKVVEREFSFEHLITIDSNSCFLYVSEM